MFKKILVAIDGSATAHKGLQQAIWLAREQGAELTVLHVLDLYRAAADMQAAMVDLYAQHVQRMRLHGRQLLEQAARAAAAAGVSASTRLRESAARVSDAIVAEARDGFDLLVLGTHGRRGLQRVLLGSDAELVARMAPIPVLLVRGDEQESGSPSERA